MAKIPVILEAGRADGKLIKTNSVYDANQEKFLSDKIKEIDEANLNFMMEKLSIEFKASTDEEAEEVMKEVRKIVKKMEPDAVIS